MSTRDRVDMNTPAPESPLGAASTTWGIDTDQSEARFAASTLWGGIPVTGDLGEVSGTLAWDGVKGHGRLAIATATLSSGIALRDRHLRSRAFFHVAKHREVTFEAREVVADGDDVRLRGELTVRARRHPFECTASITAIDENLLALETETAFDLDQLEMSRGLLRTIPAGVKATVRVVLKRVAA